MTIRTVDGLDVVLDADQWKTHILKGHPELTRIYMPEDYEGWPMRRDFPLEGHLKFRD